MLPQVAQILRGLSGRPPAAQISSIRCLLRALCGASQADVQALLAPGSELSKALESQADVAIFLLYMEKFMLYIASNTPLAYYTLPIGAGSAVEWLLGVCVGRLVYFNVV